VNPVIELKNVIAGYGKHFRLKDISLSIKEHGITGIIGPNGSGKTTFLKAVSRYLRPESGTVLLNGRDIWETPIKDFAQRLAVVSQQTDLEAIPVYDYVMMGRIPHYGPFQFFDSRADIEKTEKNIGLAGIREIRNKHLDSISGGERQLAQFARGLNQEPEVLLLDEPTSHLDIRHQVEILDLIRKYNRDTGLTIIMVLHDLNLASEYCDHLVLMKEGGVRYSGTPGEVLNYKIIEEIYETVVIVKENPVSKKPYVFLVSEEEMKKRGSINDAKLEK
jgi:iron complex transport system ATP-binding protein